MPDMRDEPHVDLGMEPPWVLHEETRMSHLWVVAVKNSRALLGSNHPLVVAATRAVRRLHKFEPAEPEKPNTMRCRSIVYTIKQSELRARHAIALGSPFRDDPTPLVVFARKWLRAVIDVSHIVYAEEFFRNRGWPLARDAKWSRLRYAWFTVHSIPRWFR